jgi:glycosyltransferase involved in cell wall biosynthesis
VLLPRLARLFDAWLPEWDMVMACGVHPITSLVLRMARRRGIPAQLWVRGDLVADVQHKYSGVRRLAAVAIARMTTASIPNGTPVVSIGRDDYPFLARMGPVRVAFSSKFGEEELVAEPRVARGNSEPRRILYVGRISAEKGLDVLIEAIRVLETRRPGAFALTLVGSDLTGSAYGDAFRSRLAASKMADAVTIRGYVPYGPALWNVYDSHDVLVLPSFTEGFPQVLFEAMARGIPIVATAVGGVPTLVRDGENGLLIPPGRPDLLADAVARLVDDPGLSERLSRGGLTCAAAHSRRTQVESISAFTTACLGGVG